MLHDQDPGGEHARILSPEWKKPSPDTITSAAGSYPPRTKLNNVAGLIKRLRALTLRLLPLEVDVKTINDPTNRIITPRVMSSYMQAAGDFGDAVGPPPTPGIREHDFFLLFSSHTASSEHIQISFAKHDATLPITVKTLVVVCFLISTLGVSH